MKATKQIEEGGACDMWKQKIKKKKISGKWHWS